MYDLHTHSNISDGTQPVDQLVAQVATSGLSGFALTDHDSTQGWGQAAQAAQEHNLDFIPGMEISCSWRGISVHLLSYAHNPAYQPLTQEVEGTRQARLNRARAMVDRLAEDYPISWELVQEQVADPSTTLGRPHIADALVALGAVETRSQAFSQILAPTSPYYIHQPALDPARAVELVRAAGGVPVLAHPRAASRGKTLPDEAIYQLVDAGLGGLEVYHRDNSEEGRAWLLKLAAAEDLLVTGSSDYHGAGKPNQLGENQTSPETVQALKERVTSGLLG